MRGSYIKIERVDEEAKSSEWTKMKKALTVKLKGFFNKYGSYLLSRILVQYHRP